MTLLFILLTIILLLIALLFAVKSQVNLSLDSASLNMNLTLFWLYPLLKSVIVRKEDGFVLFIYLMNKKVLTKKINRKQKLTGEKNILKSLNPTEIHVNTIYGFRDPFVTGLACSAIGMISQFLKVESLHQRPDFLAINDYITLNADAKLNLGNSLMRLIQKTI